MIKLFFCAHLVSLTLAWGGEGHRLITSLAIKQMKSRHRHFLLKPLGDLMKASTWADTDEAEARYPLSGADHFSNTPYRACSDFNMARDCGSGRRKGRCIVTGLARAISVAIDPEVSESDRTDSLKFILHLMADIHQPLHTGFREDAGGLNIFLSEPADMDLHAVWDTKVIDELEASMRSTDLISGLQSKLETKNQSFARRITDRVNLTDVLSSPSLMTAYAADIASDTVRSATCRSAYVHVSGEWIENGDSLSSDFFESRIPIVVVQILKASVRLGQLLDAIAETLYMRIKEKRRAERAARLSETVATEDEIEENLFSLLAFMESSDSEDMVIPRAAKQVVSPSRLSRVEDKKTKDRLDHKLLDEETALMESERTSYIFNGIDLSDVTIEKVNGLKVITTRKRLSKNRREDILTVSCPVIHTREDGTLTQQDLVLDQAAFPGIDDDGVLRIYLKLIGVDPRIDITEYRERIRILRQGSRESSIIWDALYDEHYDRCRNVSNIPVREQIEGKKGKILRFDFDNEREPVSVFVLRETLLKRQEELPNRSRFHRYKATFSGKATSIYIDPSIVDTSLYDGSTDFRNLYTLFQASRLTHSDHGMKSLIQEISEVDRAHKNRMKGLQVPYHISGKFVEWYFDFYGDESNTYSIFEWFKRGVTEEQIMNELGLNSEEESSEEDEEDDDDEDDEDDDDDDEDDDEDDEDDDEDDDDDDLSGNVLYRSDSVVPVAGIPANLSAVIGDRMEQISAGPFRYGLGDVVRRILNFFVTK